jgi:hypothetical protein
MILVLAKQAPFFTPKMIMPNQHICAGVGPAKMKNTWGVLLDQFDRS